MTLREKFLQIEAELNEIVVNQEDFIRGITIGILANTNVLGLGIPGVGKSFTVNLYLQRITGGRYFSYLMGQYTTPEDILGPYDILKLEKEGRYSRVVDNHLPNSDIAFIDEIFKGNAGVINTLLKVMNEREFDDDGQSKKLKLLTMIGASNELPEEADGLAAALDRFGLKFRISAPSDDVDFVRVLQTPDRLAAMSGAHTTISLEEIAEARQEILNVDFPETMQTVDMVKIRRQLAEKQILPSPRVWVNSVKLVRANAWLNGRTSVKQGDMAILKDALWSKPEDIKETQTTVLRVTMPEQQEIQDQYERAVELFDAYSKAWHKLHSGTQADSADLAHKKGSLIVEYTQKLRNVNLSLSKLEKTMSQKLADPKVTVKPDMSRISTTIQKVSQMVTAISNGLDPDTIATKLNK